MPSGMIRRYNGAISSAFRTRQPLQIVIYLFFYTSNSDVDPTDLAVMKNSYIWVENADTASADILRGQQVPECRVCNVWICTGIGLL